MIEPIITDVGESQRAQPATTVVVATTDALLRWALVEHLGDFGYAVVEADSVAELRARLARRVSAVVLDETFDLGEFPGAIVVVGQRAPDAMLILLAVEASARATELAARRGVTAVLRKPFDFDELTRALGAQAPSETPGQ
jgi:DNA-binding NtrC family response regulator